MILQKLFIRILMGMAVVLNFIPHATTLYNLTTLIFIGYLVYYFILETRYFIIYFFVLSSILTNLLSTLVLETQNLYLYELDTISFYSGSFKYAFLFLFITNEFLYYFYKRSITNLHIDQWKDPSNVKLNIIDKLMLVIYIALVGYFLINIIDKPFWKVSVGKFAYEQEVFSNVPLLGEIKTILMYYSVYLGFMFSRSKNKLFIFLFLLSVLSYFWIGQKYSSLLFMGFYFVFPSLLKMSVKKIRKVSMLIGLMVLIILFGNRLIFVNSPLNTVSKDINQYFYERLAQQNQLWWYFYTHNNQLATSHKFSELIEDIKYSNESEDDYKQIKSGEYKLIEKSAGESVALARAKLNAPFATGVHSQVYYYSGSIFIVLIYVVLWSFYYNKITFMFFKLVGNHTFLASMIIILFSKIYKMSFEVGFQIVNRIFQITNITTIVLIILIITISKVLDNLKQRG